ncbi:MAG: hypothetical protein Q9201_006122 [Fulgogasparrea decipioides]
MGLPGAFSVLIPLAIFIGSVCGTQYVVYPTDRQNARNSQQITNHLSQLLGADGFKIYHSPPRGATEFWLLLRPTPDQVTEISQQEYVKSVLPNVIVVKDCEAASATEILNGQSNATISDSGNEGATQTPRPPPRPRPPPPRSVVLQPNAPQDLDIVSWSVVKPLPWKMKGYAYDVKFGRDTYIYVIDNGLNGQSKEFRDVEWHYGDGVSRQATDDSKAGHGTCVSSKAAGWKNGVSKNSRLVMMKSSGTVADETWAFAEALDDILSKQRQRKAVVVYPRLSLTAFAPGSEPAANWDSIQALIRDLFEANVVVVNCAGNEATPRSSRGKQWRQSATLLILSRWNPQDSSVSQWGLTTRSRLFTDDNNRAEIKRKVDNILDGDDSGRSLDGPKEGNELNYREFFDATDTVSNQSSTQPSSDLSGSMWSKPEDYLYLMSKSSQITVDSNNGTKGYLDLPLFDLALLTPDINAWVDADRGLELESVKTCLRNSHVYSGGKLHVKEATSEQVDAIMQNNSRINLNSVSH